jgi:hypothetical protein
MLIRGSSRAEAGQAMVEFALAVGLFLLVIGGLVQFALILWSQNTINQITRDTARWEVTRSAVPCDSAASRAEVAGTANELAQQWSLIARSMWPSAPSIGAVGASGVGVDWRIVDPPPGVLTDPTLTDCPASDNRLAWLVTVRINHTVPIVMPGLQFIAPSCGAPGFCISSVTELRMEPKRPQ